MRPVLLAVCIAVLAGNCCAAEDNFCVLKKEPKAKGPIGAVVECAGVFVGEIASAVEISATGERKLTVANETGECKVFPFGATTKIADQTFSAVTPGSLKTGDKVKVNYEKVGGKEKATQITVMNDK